METDYETRRRRLRQWIDERCNGSQTEFVVGTKVQLSQLGQWLNGVRNLSEKSARRLETSKRMPKRWLDDLSDASHFDSDTLRVAQVYQDMNTLDLRARRVAKAFVACSERDKKLIEAIAAIRSLDDKEDA